CCGSGTILTEALRAGWNEVRGADIDPGAIEAAGRNAAGARLAVGDAREIDLGTPSMDACVSNLPFGQRYGGRRDMSAWLRAVLAELGRVSRPRGPRGPARSRDLPWSRPSGAPPHGPGADHAARDEDNHLGLRPHLLVTPMPAARPEAQPGACGQP